MAAQPCSPPVTPQRVRDILSSFLHESETRTPTTSVYFRPEKRASIGADKSPLQLSNLSGSPGSRGVSPEQASNRRTFPSFLRRVETFSPITWFAKPADLSPLACSRFGWENTEYDMLHCTACSANLCGTLPTKTDSSVYKEACDSLIKKLQTAHEKFCTLAVNPCPEAFLKIGLHDVEELRRSFWQRVAALKCSTQHLPDLVYTKLEIWGFAETHAAKFCAEENMPESETPSQVITLAFTGWTVKETNQQVVVCSLCRRQVGLWNYKPAHSKPVSNGQQHDSQDKGDEDSSCESGPPSKMRKIETQSLLDPISSHHSWCPWIALRIPTEDALTLLPIPDNATSTSTPVSSPPSATVPSPPSSTVPSPGPDDESPGQGGGDASRMLSHKQPAWVLVVRMVAPGLLSQSRRLVQQVKQSSIVEGLHCIRNVLRVWSPPKSKPIFASMSASPS